MFIGELFNHDSVTLNLFKLIFLGQLLKSSCNLKKMNFLFFNLKKYIFLRIF